MTGLDTNILVRYIMQDDPRQSPKANRLIESLDSSNPGYIATARVVELYWVLTFCYDLTREQVAQARQAVPRTKQLWVERSDQVLRALRIFGAGRHAGMVLLG